MSGIVLLLQIDRLPPHVIVICATNHGELLDRAAWRRFQLRLALESPSRVEATKFLEMMSARLGGDLGFAPRTLADKLAGASYAELEQFAQDVRRRFVLSLPEANLDKIVRSRLEQWRMGLIEPIGAGYARYEPCPETDPDLPAEGPLRCVNCHRTDRNPAARSFDMDLPAPILCDMCVVEGLLSWASILEDQAP